MGVCIHTYIHTYPSQAGSSHFKIELNMLFPTEDPVKQKMCPGKKDPDESPYVTNGTKLVLNDRQMLSEDTIPHMYVSIHIRINTHTHSHARTHK